MRVTSSLQYVPLSKSDLLLLHRGKGAQTVGNRSHRAGQACRLLRGHRAARPEEERGKRRAIHERQHRPIGIRPF